jgi:xylan 1,4-beta-xylosidase
MRLFLLTLAVPLLLQGAEVSVDLSHPLGAIRTLQGVNNGPLCNASYIDLTTLHREIGVSWNRLHDTPYQQPDAVDIHCIFPDLRADPAQPESYHFGRTDELLAAIAQTGAQTIYRLGESIEHGPRKLYVHPPANMEKWAAICAGIVAHYNDGWADGMRLGITHWEIWNEPENRPVMWSGSDDDYIRLYATTARVLKARWPDLKIGGPAAGYTGEFKDGRFIPSEFLVHFLDYCRAQEVPLDFLSWHRYADDPHEFARRAVAMHRLLDEHGFPKAESILDEWNWLPGEDWTPVSRDHPGPARDALYAQIGGPAGAAFIACTLAELQDAPLDIACFYTGDCQGFGLFTQHGTPKKAYQAFRAWHMLLETPKRVAATVGEPGRWAVCAGTDASASEARVLISHFRSDDSKVSVAVKGVPWPEGTTAELFLVDAQRDLELVRRETFPAGDFTCAFELPAPAIAVLKLHRVGQ